MNSCPNCDAPAPARARVCPACGYRFLEDRRPGRTLVERPGRALLGIATGAAVVAAVVILIPGGGGDASSTAVDADRPPDLPRAPTELLSNHPLSRRAAESRLEERFTSLQAGRPAAARCSGREPRPAHALRHCNVRYPSGASRRVVVLLDARGRELLSEY